MNGRTPAERARRAATIRALLDHPQVREGFEAVEEELTAEWKRAQSVEERETLWRALNLVERVRTWLRSAASHDLTALRRGR
ncbi:hypothetical protein [Sphingosinicella terrae]|uniref:hypothetical protein n=1 Tax=Sphingosinicella terrae TaxID=2172047 RepID=UPI000E0D5083|nr:hypothetical protein [Sphingosinicella terrae]